MLSVAIEDYSLDISQCQVVLMSQPDKSPNLSYQASDFVFQSILVTSPSKNKLPLKFESDLVRFVYVCACAYIPTNNLK